MNKNLGFELIVYSLLLAGLSFFAHYLSPTIARLVLITGLVGGALCLVWGLRAVQGKRGKALPVLTLTPISFVMLSQTVLAWGGGTQEAPGRLTAAAVITLLLAFSLGMLMRIAYAGAAIYGPPPGPAKNPGAPS